MKKPPEGGFSVLCGPGRHQPSMKMPSFCPKLWLSDAHNPNSSTVGSLLLCRYFLCKIWHSLVRLSNQDERIRKLNAKLIA
jgi:hypothetical protein